MDSLKTRFEDFLHLEEKDGSTKAVSYMHAFNFIEPVLRKQMEVRGFPLNIFELNAEQLAELRLYVLDQQHKSDGGDFAETIPPSYWKKNFCSAVMAALIRFAEFCSVK